MSTLDSIQISQRGIGHALADGYLQVPKNQRSYKWEETHVLDLFQDIGSAIADHEGEYFLGSIVVAGKTNRPEVVDGQQRLATTTILLAAIRDYFVATGDSTRADDLERDYLLTRELRSGATTPRLKLNAADNDFFRTRILSRADSEQRKAAQKSSLSKDSHKRIDVAAKLAAAHVAAIVKPYSETKKAERLIDWVDYIRDQSRVIWVTVPDHANAFVIFETLNDRGLELTIADLLKNYLFGRSGDRMAESEQRWMQMIGALEAVTTDDISVMYIRHMWASLYGPVREKHLYSSIKKQTKNQQKAVDLATELADNAGCYAAILNSDHEMWGQYGSASRRHIATLRMLRAEQMRPLILAVLKTFSVAEAKKALPLFVSWAVRFLIVGGHGGGVMEKTYSECAVAVRAAKIKTTAELAKHLKPSVPSDRQFEAAFATSTVSQLNLARYYLRTLELKKGGEKEPEMVPNSEESDVNLEHVLPQNPGKDWKNFTPELAAASYRRLGNMALMRVKANNSIGNAKFSVKLAQYKKSSYILTKSLGKYAEWGITQIDERQAELASLAVETWPIS
jgi:hypothetical protein